MAIRTISLFSGAGGLDLAVELGTEHLGLGDVHPLCYVEREVSAAKILAARMAEGSLRPAPIWSDVTTFNGNRFRGLVDGIIGGFPCPDYSVAGKRAGIGGKHGQLWNSFRRIIREADPGWVFLENVPGILCAHKIKRWRCVDHDLFGRTIWEQYLIPAGLWFVLGDLAAMGFHAEWGCLPAIAVGASHKRERWFCLAYRPERGCGELRKSSRRDGFTNGCGEELADGGYPEPRQDGEGQAAGGAGERSEPVGDTASARPSRREPGSGGTLWDGARREESGRRCDAVGDSECSRRQEAGSGSVIDTGRQSEPGCCDLAIATEPRLEIGRCERSDGECERAATRSRGEVEHAYGSRLGENERRAQVDGAESGGRDAYLGPAAEKSGAGLPLFAPGPSDPHWQDVLVRYPWLRPAIAQAEAQSDFCQLPDGLADLVVHERADALRAVGNGVVVIQGASMFIELTRRMKWHQHS